MKPSSNLFLLFNQFNNFSLKLKNDPKNVVNSYCYHIDQFQILKFPGKIKSLSLFHINPSSFSKNFVKLEHLLKYTNSLFDIFVVSETRITKLTILTSNINLQNYSFEFTPTESNARGNLLYIANHLFYKPHPDLVLKKANQLESIFIEIKNYKKAMSLLVAFINIVIWTFVTFDSFDFVWTFESLASNSFKPYILQQTRTTSHTKALTESIFSNMVSHEVISGNVTASMSDQLTQFLFAAHVFSNPSLQKSNMYERGFSEHIQTDFLLDFFDKNWSDDLQLDQGDVNLSIESFIGNMNTILDEHEPLKLINKYKLEFKNKP